MMNDRKETREILQRISSILERLDGRISRIEAEVRRRSSVFDPRPPKMMGWPSEPPGPTEHKNDALDD
jgi:hypothetical protein